MKGENAGVMGESWVFTLQNVCGASELAFEPGDTLGAIQLVVPWLYSKLREVVTTRSDQTSIWNLVGNLLPLVSGEKLSVLCRFICGPPRS